MNARFGLGIDAGGTYTDVALLDLGYDPSREYLNAATVADPGYPFQYTTSVDPARDAAHVLPPLLEQVGGRAG